MWMLPKKTKYQILVERVEPLLGYNAREGLEMAVNNPETFRARLKGVFQPLPEINKILLRLLFEIAMLVSRPLYSFFSLL